MGVERDGVEGRRLQACMSDQVVGTRGRGDQGGVIGSSLSWGFADEMLQGRGSKGRDEMGVRGR